MGTGTTTKLGQKIDDLMQRADAALIETRYFECERLATEALRLAHGAGDYDRMARVLLPLQEARRQKRLAAIDSGAVHSLERRAFAPSLDGEECEPAPVIDAGCWLVAPPLVGADGRDLRERADAAGVPVLVIVREPQTRTGQWPIVMIGPSTVRTKVAPPKKLVPEWFLAVSEALGDAAIEEVDPSLPGAVRVDRLLDRLQTLPDHEKLHQALGQACHEAMREDAAGAPTGRRRPARPAPDDDAHED